MELSHLTIRMGYISKEDDGKSNDLIKYSHLTDRKADVSVQYWCYTGIKYDCWQSLTCGRVEVVEEGKESAEECKSGLC